MVFAPDEHGPFDIIGDVHGCVDELVALLRKLGYGVEVRGREFEVTAPAGRRVIFLGDLVDRGPDMPGVLRLVMGMVASGVALCVPGNHDLMVVRAMRGEETEMPEAVQTSLTQLAGETVEFREAVSRFVAGLEPYLILDDDRLVVAHAGLIEQYQGRPSAAAVRFACYGANTLDAEGNRTRYRWAETYRGERAVVYGHTPQTDLTWVNGTLCVDTGCVYGGGLTAVRWPERAVVSVAAERVYWENRRSAELRAAWGGASGGS